MLELWLKVNIQREFYISVLVRTLGHSWTPFLALLISSFSFPVWRAGSGTTSLYWFINARALSATCLVVTLGTCIPLVPLILKLSSLVGFPPLSWPTFARTHPSLARWTRDIVPYLALG